MSTNVTHTEAALRRAPPQACGVDAARDADTLLGRIHPLVSGIEPPRVRDAANEIFSTLSRLLGYLCAVEDGLRSGRAPVGAHLIFRLVQLKATELIEFIESEALALPCLEERVRVALDGLSFAIRHELRRVYQEELGALAQGRPVRLTRGETARAYGLLLSCFQQTTVTFAQAFDPKLDGTHLFDDLRVRREQSLQLYRELLALHERVLTAEEVRDISAHISLVEHLQEFRSDSMHLLMYRDWDEFERLTEEVTQACETRSNAARALNVFSCYLQTLIGHVRLRNALHGAV